MALQSFATALVSFVLHFAIVADGDYSNLRLKQGGVVPSRKSLRSWEQRLPNPEFARVHRSAIVNLECVARVEEWSHRTYLLHLQTGGEPIPMSGL